MLALRTTHTSTHRGPLMMRLLLVPPLLFPRPLIMSLLLVLPLPRFLSQLLWVWLVRHRSQRSTV